MLKRLLSGVIIGLLPQVKAELNLSFESIDSPTEIHDKVRIVRDVSIQKEKNKENKFLRLHAPNKKSNAIVIIPTGLDNSTNFTLSFDWRSNRIVPGKVISLCDWNHNKRLLDILIEKGKIVGTTFKKNRFKKRRLLTADNKHWQQFTIKVTGNTYSILIVDKASGRTVYNSVSKKLTFYVNSANSPAKLLLSQWPGQPANNYDYDNIILTAE